MSSIITVAFCYVGGIITFLPTHLPSIMLIAITLSLFLTHYSTYSLVLTSTAQHPSYVSFSSS